MINTLVMENCEECFRIKCRGCGWEPDSKVASLIQAGKVTACPDCGWKPGGKDI